MDQKDLEQRLLLLEQKVSEIEKLIVGNDKPVNVKDKIEKKMSVKEFLLSKKANNDVERTLLIGYFLEKFEEYSSFNSDDLRDGFRNAKIKSPLNINDKVNLNIAHGHMMEVAEKKDSKKAWVLTVSGESCVENNFIVNL